MPLPTSVRSCRHLSPRRRRAWLHEIKDDGYRTLVAIDGSRVRAFTRNGHDWTDRYAYCRGR